MAKIPYASFGPMRYMMNTWRDTRTTVARFVTSRRESVLNVLKPNGRTAFFSLNGICQ